MLKLNELQKFINNKVSTECNSLSHLHVNVISHCHIVSKHDVRKVISNSQCEKDGYIVIYLHYLPL